MRFPSWAETKIFLAHWENLKILRRFFSSKSFFLLVLFKSVSELVQPVHSNYTSIRHVLIMFQQHEIFCKCLIKICTYFTSFRFNPHFDVMGHIYFANRQAMLEQLKGKDCVEHWRDVWFWVNITFICAARWAHPSPRQVIMTPHSFLEGSQQQSRPKLETQWCLDCSVCSLSQLYRKINDTL